MGLSHSETQEALDRLGDEADELRASRERIVRAEDDERGLSNATFTTARSKTSSRSRSTFSSLASSSSAMRMPPSSSSTTWAEKCNARSRGSRSLRSGSTRRSSRPEASPPRSVRPR